MRAGANRRVSEDDLRWADIVFVMESDQKAWIMEAFRSLERPKIEVLGIPDEFEAMDPELIEILKSTLDPEFEHLKSSQP